MNKEQLKRLEDDLWQAADAMRANSDLKAHEYSSPVLGLIFLRFADNKYKQYEAEIREEYERLKGGRREREIWDIAIEKCGFYLPEEARYDHLLNLSDEQDVVKAIKEAMELIEKYKTELEGILPKDKYSRLTTDDLSLPNRLLRIFADIPQDASGDLFGKIYEYFLGKFALAEGQGGGEFFTPQSVVKLMVEIIEPHGGTVYDPACGSGGMFVQSAKFIAQHREKLDQQVDSSVYVYGQDKTAETANLAKLNLAVNGLRGEILAQNTYYNNPFNSAGRFDYVLANPPFNVDDVAFKSVEDDGRFNAYGVPRNKTKVKKADEGKDTVPNANYLWINLFATSLNERGRAALVMANSASDARHSEAEIRQRLIENNLIYGMLTLPSNMFYTVTLPATLWFFDKAKQSDKILFIDARNIFTPIDRAHREFSEAQIQNIAVISKLHKGDRVAFIELVANYLAQGMAALEENQEAVKDLTRQIELVLKGEQGEQAAEQIEQKWQELSVLQVAYEGYLSQVATFEDIEAHNQSQQDLFRVFAPFFEGLHGALKLLDKTLRRHEKALSQVGKRGGLDKDTKLLKSALEQLHQTIKAAESPFEQVRWLQERFPLAMYEDVTGLCKLATPEEVKEQDYSLNPGRYVGVVIEEDGKTEEEFLTDLVEMNQQLEALNQEAIALGGIIGHNIIQLAGDEG